MPSLGEIFGKPKDKQKITEVKGIVYKFECPDARLRMLEKARDRGNHVGQNTNQA
jgi:hypothetical protein